VEPPSGGPTLKLWPKRRCYRVVLWPCGPDVSLLPLWATGLLCLHVSLYQRLTAALLQCGRATLGHCDTGPSVIHVPLLLCTAVFRCPFMVLCPHTRVAIWYNAHVSLGPVFPYDSCASVAVLHCADVPLCPHALWLYATVSVWPCGPCALVIHISL
jgi:hypothetical protein